MKGIRAAFLIVVVLCIVAAAAASLWLGKGVKAALETAGPKILGAPVTVDAVVLAPWSGRGMVKGLVIGNPPGFKGDRAVRVGSAEIAVKLSSLASDLIVVEKVDVREPELNYELGSGGSNIARLQKNAESAAGGGNSPAPAAKGGSSKSLLIKDLSVSGGSVGLAATALGGGASIPLPPVHLTNLGGKGKTPAEAAAEVMKAISGSASKAVSGIGSKALDAAASNVMGRLGGLLKGKK